MLSELHIISTETFEFLTLCVISQQFHGYLAQIQYHGEQNQEEKSEQEKYSISDGQEISISEI